MQGSRRLLLIATAIVLTACTGGTAPLKAIDRKIDLPRFMGDWYVIASIPIFLEKGAHNAVESYRLGPDGVIETTYRFRQDAFDGPVKTFHPKGFVTDTATNAEWGMQFVWPFKATYLVIYLDDAYQRTIIGVPGRQWVWLMARTPSVDPAAYAEMLEAVRAAGYDPSLVERVPQQWPDQPGR
jgi:apolipoprotein D and lipocalin family protein